MYRERKRERGRREGGREGKGGGRGRGGRGEGGRERQSESENKRASAFPLLLNSYSSYLNRQCTLSSDSLVHMFY